MCVCVCACAGTAAVKSEKREGRKGVRRRSRRTRARPSLWSPPSRAPRGAGSKYSSCPAPGFHFEQPTHGPPAGQLSPIKMHALSDGSPRDTVLRGRTRKRDAAARRCRRRGRPTHFGTPRRAAASSLACSPHARATGAGGPADPGQSEYRARRQLLVTFPLDDHR
jgi:hypothetical protein